MSSDDIVNRIVDEFRKVEREAPRLTQRQWTKKVKTTLCRLGKEEFHYEAWATDIPNKYRDGSEFLYDASWHETDNCGRIISLPMVAESEWGNSEEVDKDFKKLLLARSKVRVMVYWIARRENQKETCDRLRKYVGTFNGTEGDTYLLIGMFYESTEEVFKFQFHRITDEGPGNLPKLKKL